MYFYPMYVDDELIDTIAQSQRIVPYLDMPLQHANDTMLRRMQRRVNRADTEALLKKLRERIPNLVLRTTFITGFPGETDEQFDELVDFVREQKFERLGVFTYSHESDTPAAKLSDPVPEDVMQERRNRLMAEQQKIAFDWNDAQIGRQLDVLIDSKVPDEPLSEGRAAWIGRSYTDAPEVDGVTYVTGEGLATGNLVKCEIVARSDYDLVAVAIEKPR